MRFHADLHVRPEKHLLDIEQTNAASASVPLIVRGPDASRIFTLTRRISHAIRKRGAAEANCLVIVGGSRAAAVIRANLDRFLPSSAGQVAIHTLHSLGLAILREHGTLAGLNRGFRVACEVDRAAIFAEMRGFPASKVDEVLRAISRMKRGVAPCGEDGAEAFAAYQQGLMLRNLVDYDDLVRLPLQLMAEHAEIAALLTRHFPLVLVEPQDMDEQQARFVHSIASERSRKVGKRGQMIYLRPDRVTVRTAVTELAEAEYVIRTIDALREERPLGDFAVLYRSETQSGAFLEAFESSGIPFRRRSHALLADDPTVRALFLELYDVPSEESLPHRLQAAALRLRDNKPGIDGAAIDGALQRLTRVAATSLRNSLRFADAVALARDADFLDPRADCVSLLTLEAAEGLQFPVVFIVGLEDGVLPLHWSKPDEAALVEERRLFYVGMTRAMDRLYLSRAQRRLWHGRVQELPPSPFLEDIESELLKHQRPAPRPARPEDRQLKLF